MADIVDSSKLDWPEYDGICEAPDLADLGFLSLTMMMSRGFLSGGPKDPTQYALTMNFVRLVDKAVIDYGHARSALHEWVSTPNGLGYSFLAVGHFESCFEAIERAFRFLKALVDSPLSGKLAGVDFGVLAEGAPERVRKVRNSIQHLDERVTDGKVIRDGEFRCLMPVKGGIRMAPEFVTYADLAMWLRRLHAVATPVSCYREDTVT